MKILLSNDDGIGAPGIVVLEELAKKIASEVFVVAPVANMSAAGHSLTLKTPLRLKKKDDHHFAVNGTPTDCVVMAVRHIMSEKPDLMLSGINYDANLAEDITYSGTVAAAMEARLLGVPAIAFSQQIFRDGVVNWDIAKKFGPEIIKTVLQHYKMPTGVLLNVNFPAVENISDVKGIRITNQGFRGGEDQVIQAVDPRGDPYFWIGGAEYRMHDKTSALETDLGAINSGYISITPISLNFTERLAIKDLEGIFHS